MMMKIVINTMVNLMIKVIVRQVYVYDLATPVSTVIR